MRILSTWLLLLVPVTASPHQQLLGGKLNFGRYILDGQVMRTQAKAYQEADGLTIRVGIPPVGPRQEVFYLKYTKLSADPDGAYQVDFISFNYTTDSGVYGVNYNTDLHSTLHRTPSGGYSGTFSGVCPAQASVTGKISRVTGVFTNVHCTSLSQK
jgi:hypothetical protein